MFWTWLFLLGWLWLDPLAVNTHERAEGGFVLGLEPVQGFKGFAEVIVITPLACVDVSGVRAIDGAD